MTVKGSFGAKFTAFVLAVLAFVGAACLAAYQIANVETLWFDDEYNYTVGVMSDNHRRDAERLVYYSRQDPGSLSVLQQEAAEELEATLNPKNTNFRWMVVNGKNEVLWGNTDTIPSGAIQLHRHIITIGTEGTLVQDGDLLVWVDPALPVDDGYKTAVLTLEMWDEHRFLALGGTAALALLGIALTVWLCAASGHRKGREGISLCWFHLIPGDLLLAAWIIGGVGLAVGLSELWWVMGDIPLPLLLVCSSAIAAGFAVLIISLLITVSARCKGHILLRQTIIGGILIRLWRLGCRCTEALPLVWKTALGGLVYLLVSILLIVWGYEASGFVVVWVSFTLLVILWALWWAVRWKRIRQGTSEIIGGNTSCRIDTSSMPPDLKAHGEELNNLGVAIGAAVEERLKSEHFRAELITNVSHDLKTPLTSIINYVDLLKKENIDSPRAAEYIEVLERKGRILQKLTEDLVEASKASTGAVTINRERLDLCQLAGQALAEYEGRLAERGLKVVYTAPDSPVSVEADGRHLWRVVDNLLSNCAKYAMPGTRVYVEVQEFADCARLSVKNISHEPLNMDPGRLVERFVRGDESRTAEGSGLGLSIAQSLTELQGGSFELSIDGDLFKAVVTLPTTGQMGK